MLFWQHITSYLQLLLLYGRLEKMQLLNENWHTKKTYKELLKIDPKIEESVKIQMILLKRRRNLEFCSNQKQGLTNPIFDDKTISFKTGVIVQKEGNFVHMPN